MSIITWNPVDKGSAITLSNNNLTATAKGLGLVRATQGKTQGKWYWEITSDVTYHTIIGVSDKTQSLSNWHTTRGYYSRGNKILNSTQLTYGDSFANDDIISVVLDLDNGAIEFFKNGVSQGVAFTDLLGLDEVFASYSKASSSGTGAITTNFGATPFKYQIPEGYLPYDYENASWFSKKKHLIKSQDKIHILSKEKDSLVYANLAEPLSQADYEKWGMDSLVGYENEIDKVFIEMNESGDLEDGRVLRKVVNKNEWKINSMSVR